MSSLINNLKTIASCRAKKQLDIGVLEENNKIRDKYKNNSIPFNENKFFYQGLKLRYDLQSTSRIYKSKLNDMTSNKNNYKIIKRSFFKDCF